jgi:hypothetical protein
MAVLIGPTILALASGRREGGEAADGRHFEILLNPTFGRAPPSEGYLQSVESGGLAPATCRSLEE